MRKSSSLRESPWQAWHPLSRPAPSHEEKQLLKEEPPGKPGIPCPDQLPSMRKSSSLRKSPWQAWHPLSRPAPVHGEDHLLKEEPLASLASPVPTSSLP